MKTLKISIVATLAAMVAWWIHLPHRIWPAHPYLADFVLTLVICVVLQFAWVEPKPETRKPV